MCNKLLIPYVFPEAIQDFYEMITYQIWKKKKTQNKTLLSIESNASYGKGLMRPSPGFLLGSFQACGCLSPPDAVLFFSLCHLGLLSFYFKTSKVWGVQCQAGLST